jgi:hypothetical protein
MKIVSLKVAGIEETPAAAPAGPRQVVADEPEPGFIRKITLGPEGLMICRGEVAVLVPLSGLISVALEAEPALRAACESSICHDGNSRTNKTAGE